MLEPHCALVLSIFDSLPWQTLDNYHGKMDVYNRGFANALRALKTASFDQVRRKRCFEAHAADLPSFTAMALN
jgi:hypothetical protein